jgi:hypothetical protein
MHMKAWEVDSSAGEPLEENFMDTHPERKEGDMVAGRKGSVDAQRVSFPSPWMSKRLVNGLCK